MKIRKLLAAVLCAQLNKIGVVAVDDIRGIELRALSIDDIPLCGVRVQKSIRLRNFYKLLRLTIHPVELPFPQCATHWLRSERLRLPMPECRTRAQTFGLHAGKLHHGRQPEYGKSATRSLSPLQ